MDRCENLEDRLLRFFIFGCIAGALFIFGIPWTDYGLHIIGVTMKIILAVIALIGICVALKDWEWDSFIQIESMGCLFFSIIMFILAVIVDV